MIFDFHNMNSNLELKIKNKKTDQELHINLPKIIEII
jgi:hypothetical protein